MTLSELAARCEAATGHDPALDEKIAVAVGWVVSKFQKDDWFYPPSGGPPTSAPRFTKSLDAAATLVPEGALWEADYKINAGEGELFERPKGEPKTVYRAGVGIGKVPMKWFRSRHFASPALALCTAALKAREHTANNLSNGSKKQ